MSETTTHTSEKRRIGRRFSAIGRRYLLARSGRLRGLLLLLLQALQLGRVVGLPLRGGLLLRLLDPLQKLARLALEQEHRHPVYLGEDLVLAGKLNLAVDPVGPRLDRVIGDVPAVQREVLVRVVAHQALAGLF